MAKLPSVPGRAVAKVAKSIGFVFDRQRGSHALYWRDSDRRPLMWEYGRNAKFFGYPKLPNDRSPNLAIRDGNWKLLVNADGENAELYDLATDPSEAKNVAKDHAAATARLQSAVLDWRKSMPSKLQAAPSN